MTDGATGGGTRPFTVAERLRGAAARALGRLPAALQIRLSGQPPVVVDGQTLDPALQLLCAIRIRRRTPDFCEPTVFVGRERLKRETAIYSGPKTAVRAVHDLVVEGETGPLGARHYLPATAPDGTAAPLLVYLHGGGFAVCDVDTHDEVCRLMCRHGGVHVLSVDYRLAPEHPFPAALMDARAALRWAQANAASLGADPRRVAIGGDSAGGNLSAVVSQTATRDGAPPVAQLLIYPVTDAVTMRPSQTLFSQGYFLSQRDRDDFSGHYSGASGVHESDPLVSPLHAAKLDGLPPALVVTAGFDILRDEGDAYADALRAAGNVVTHLRFPSMVHGFASMTGVCPGARRATIEIARAWGAMAGR
jgi:acetyl esterase